MNIVELIQQGLDKQIDDLVDFQDYTSLETPLKKSDQIKQEAKHDLKQSVGGQALYQKTVNAIQFIHDHIQEVGSIHEAEQVKQELKAADQHFVDYIKHVSDLLDKPEQKVDVNQEPQNFQAVLKLSDHTIDLIYQLARQLYIKDQIELAKDIFQFIIYLDPHIAQFWLGLGLCYYKEKKLVEALEFFEISEILDSHNPVAYIYKAECLIANNEKQRATDEIKGLEALLQSNKQLREEWVTSLEDLKIKLNQSSNT